MFHRLTVLNGRHLRLLWFDRLRFGAQRRRHVDRHNRNRQLPHPLRVRRAVQAAPRPPTRAPAAQ
ncbi:hypothetical protein LZ757_03220 [Xylella fastidiosa subsp. morus]|uniref:hypothetical protein n=1 Tax=Xylella fastidiosa TaxID=2371 RepID=UPI001566970F|nr:hypothetical protein [Xylella fastidiosa]UIN28519.1 hypothetical protein IUD23_03205 [Xylella fastidiosa subsp. morus]UIT37262.1 hypothetical protein LZ757_03220 [Xylella fastidiosa subsp. morus]UIT39557.1 hypothetical protein LZ755_03230 [Xylella fastidiosa subsp. morus]UIT43998.1 hypothetical protein LZ758_03215 [Xylella fastidiosa subsp. morus]